MTPWDAIKKIRDEIEASVQRLDFDHAATLRSSLERLKQAQNQELDEQWSDPPYMKNRLRDLI